MKSEFSHPYFINGRLDQIRDGHASMDADTLRRLKASVAINAADPAAVAAYANLHGEGWMDFYPQRKTAPAPNTDSAITTFLDTYGGGSDRETQLLERLIFNPTPDYATVLAREETERRAHQEPDLSQPGVTEQLEQSSATADSQDALLDAFIATHPDGETIIPEPEHLEMPQKVEKPAKPVKTPEKQPSSLSESLAKIYIRQGHYRQAYDIISQLYLNFPEKSVYFADQLRFLQKLMLITGK